MKSAKDRQQCSDGWARYHGFRLSPEKLRACKGCQLDSKERLSYGVCALPHIRNCVIKTGIETCAQCSAFPCQAQKDRSDFSRETVAARLGTPVPEDDYHRFIEPYEAMNHLQTLRAKLDPTAIVNAVKAPPLETHIVDFPTSLRLSAMDATAFKALHRLLSMLKRAPLGLEGTDTYAQRARLEKRQRQFVRLLWIFGRFGELGNATGAHLTVDSAMYVANRLGEAQLANWAFLQHVLFKVFPEYGVQLGFVPLKAGTERQCVLPSGWLRNKGWVMTMRLTGATGGESTIKALADYTRRLDERYGKGGFRHFFDVDMRVLGER